MGITYVNKPDSEVGYGKPPKKYQFKPGKSGNPKGRPKGTRNLVTDLAEELSESIQVNEGGKVKKISKQRAMIKAQVAKALKGDVRAANTLLNLIPRAEESQQAQALAEELSKTDQEILAEFTKRFIESKEESSND